MVPLTEEMEIFHRTCRSVVRAACGVQLKDWTMAKYLMLMLGLNEAMDQFARMEDSGSA